jgi:hypothetical protein
MGAGDGFLQLAAYALLHMAEVTHGLSVHQPAVAVQLNSQHAPVGPTSAASDAVATVKSVSFAADVVPSGNDGVTSSAASTAQSPSVTDAMDRRPLWIGYLVDAVSALEVGLTLSRYNHHFRLLLLRLYAHPVFGAVQAVRTLYERLDLKTVQHESLSYLALPDTQRFGSVEATRAMAEVLLRFHRDHNRDSPESVTLAYRQVPPLV